MLSFHSTGEPKRLENCLSAIIDYRRQDYHGGLASGISLITARPSRWSDIATAERLHRSRDMTTQACDVDRLETR